MPVRQWVCSLRWSVRYALAYDRRLCAEVLDAFVVALTRSLRWRAKRRLGLSSVEDTLVGAVTFIQRVHSALRISVHFHTIALDGAYVRDAEGELVFHGLPEPSAEEVAQVAEWTHAGLVRGFARHGRSRVPRTHPTAARRRARARLVLRRMQTMPTLVTVAQPLTLEAMNPRSRRGSKASTTTRRIAASARTRPPTAGRRRDPT